MVGLFQPFFFLGGDFMDYLDTKIEVIKGIGPKKIEAFHNASIYTLRDLVYYYPKQYITYEPANYEEADNGDKILVRGILSSKIFYRKMANNVALNIFTLLSNNRKIKVTFFSKAFFRYNLKLNDQILVYGVKKENNCLQGLKLFTDDFNFKIEVEYKIKDINDSFIHKILESLFKYKLPISTDIPPYLEKKYRLLDIDSFIRLSHFPSTKEDIRQLGRRIRYLKYFKYSLNIEAISALNSLTFRKKKLVFKEKIEEFIANLPFKLTNSQIQALNDIYNDFTLEKPMNRLIQGDVGSGKTIVAVIASLINYLNGYQTIIMSPTEILTNQHYNSFKTYFLKYPINIALLTSKTKTLEKRQILEGLTQGTIDILISTHAILYSDFEFKSLGLYIVDEQHRFGVEARRKIIDLYENTDALYLSATPIPRTLGLTKFKDMDISSITEKPKNRKTVETKVISTKNLSLIYKDISDRLNRNEQVYVVVSVIESFNNRFDIERVKELLEANLSSAKIGIIHSEVKQKNKDEIFEKYLNNEYNILLSTTVIEVGVDVKNATGIYIFDAERFGLSTLHQLRGRVGRNDKPSVCYLITKNTDTERLRFLEDNNDCFSIADYDLKMRGPGDLLGNLQSGFFDFDLENDIKVYECAKNDAKELFLKYMNKEKLDDITTNIVSEVSLSSRKLN